MANLNRRDAYSAIPQLEKKISDLGKYISVEDGKLSIRIDNAYGDIAELTIQADQIEGRVENAEGSISTLTQRADSITSKVQAIENDYVTSTVLQQTAQGLTLEINEKAEVFTSQPTPPYTVGDLWVQGPSGEIYRCKTSRSSGSYSASDWELASDYTDDTTANSALSVANTEVATRTTMIRSMGSTSSFGAGTLTCYQGGSQGVFVNANGTVEIVTISWSGSTPTKTDTIASYGSTTMIGQQNNVYLKITSTKIVVYDKTSGINDEVIVLNGSSNPYLDVGYSRASNAYSRLYSNELRFYVRGGSAAITGGLTQGDGDIFIGAKRFISDYYIEAGTRFRSIYTYEHPSDTVTTSNLYVNSNGTFMKTASGSSKRYKYDIEDADRNTFDPRALYDIPFRQFRFKEGYFGKEVGENAAKKLRQGFVAEEVYDAYPPATVFEDGKIETWSEREMIPPMLALIQEQNERIKELERKVS